MAYNPYSSIKEIYGLKGQWDEANNAGDADRKNKVAARAKQYYDQLRSNGYGDVADELGASDYGKSKVIRDKWAKTGRTSTRDYLYSLGKSKGLSQSDVDGLIGWDNTTGEVSFGGKKIGTPDAVVDGVSYWSDPAVLDTAFNDYVSRSGTVRTKSSAVDQENENLFGLYNREYEDLKNENPFETEVGKSILAKYDLAGLQGRDNAVASGAGSNGGNIDSFAAANALRQQSSLISQGQTAALEAHKQKLEHARALLSDMGVNIDRVFNQDETSKNNDVARKSEIAAVSGYTPTEWAVGNDAFLRNFVDENGALKPEYYDVDFQKLINNAKASGNTDLAEKYAILRGLKITGNFAKYGKYLNEGDISYVKPDRTADYDLTKQQIDSNERTSKAALESNEKIAGMEAQNKLDQIKTTAEYKNGVPYASSGAGVRIQPAGGVSGIGYSSGGNGTSYGGNYGGGSYGGGSYSGGSGGTSGGSSGAKPTLDKNQAAQAVKQGQITPAVLYAYNYWYHTNFTMDNPPAPSKLPKDETYDSPQENTATESPRTLDPNYKPTLTASQAANAVKSGEITQTVLDAYNYYYGTSYTLDNPPGGANSGTGASGGFDLLGGTAESDDDTDYGANLNNVYDKSSDTVKDYIRNELEPLVTDNTVTETELKNHLINNSAAYDLEVKDIKAICEAFGVDSKWVDDYKNAGLFGWGSGVVPKKSGKK